MSEPYAASKPEVVRQQVPQEALPPPSPAPSSRAPDRNLTISTQLSTDQLICKTPQESPTNSLAKPTLRTPMKTADGGSGGGGGGGKILLAAAPADANCYSVLLYLALMQIFLGLLMCTFGVLVIMNEASLAQIGGGLWGGCLAVSAGTAGILAAAKSWCPLRTGAQRVAQTVSLTLNMITLAIAQLVLVLAATGLARDVHKSEIIESSAQVTEDIVEVLPSNYPALLSNVGLLIIAAFETVCAAIASYKTARLVCPCFRQSAADEANLHENLRIGGRDALVSSWLGKHSMQTAQPQIYVVHAPSTLGRHSSKLSGGLPFLLPQQIMGPQVYPLIPAPLGPVPSPIIPTLPRDHHYRRLLRDRHASAAAAAAAAPKARSRSASRSREVSKEKQLTEADVAKTYTGLDRIVAEEFIQICDSRNASLCSDSSCRDSCHCTSSDMGSRDYLIDKIEKI